MERIHNRVVLPEANVSEFSLIDSSQGYLPEDRVSSDEIEDLLQSLERSVSADADSGEVGFGSVNIPLDTDRDDGQLDEEAALDLSAEEMGQGPDAVRLYMREISQV